MGFNSKLTQENNVPSKYEINTDVAIGEGVKFLTPKHRPKSSGDLMLDEQKLKDAKKHVLKTLNALKIVSPLIIAIINHPGNQSKEEDVLFAFGKLIKELELQTQKICSALKVDINAESDYWIRNSVERIVAELIKDVWIKHKRLDSQKLSDLVSVCLKDISAFDDSKPQGMEALEPNVHLQISILKLTAQLQGKLLVGFDFYRKNLNEDIENIAIGIINLVGEQVMNMIPAQTNMNDRLSLFNVLLNESSLLYVNCWKVAAKRAAENLGKLTDKQLLEKINENPQGFEIDYIFEDFKQQFIRLTNLTKKLVPGKPGAIGQRIKNKE